MLSGDDAAEVADAIIRLATDPALRDRLQRGGQARLHQAHSAEVAAAAINHAIEVALARAPEPASLSADAARLARRAMGRRRRPSSRREGGSTLGR